jgi:hypothetical protein
MDASVRRDIAISHLLYRLGYFTPLAVAMAPWLVFAIVLCRTRPSQSVIVFVGVVCGVVWFFYRYLSNQ